MLQRDSRQSTAHNNKEEFVEELSAAMQRL